MAQQSRSERVVTRVEPIISRAIYSLVGQQNSTASDYLRKLAIDDLKQRGLITDSMLAELVY